MKLVTYEVVLVHCGACPSMAVSIFCWDRYAQSCTMCAGRDSSSVSALLNNCLFVIIQWIWHRWHLPGVGRGLLCQVGTWTVSSRFCLCHLQLDSKCLSCKRVSNFLYFIWPFLRSTANSETLKPLCWASFHRGAGRTDVLTCNLLSGNHPLLQI